MKPHVTLSTQFQGEAFERSKRMKALLEMLGCTCYNPNTDCPQKPGDTVKGASNWLEEFRKSLKKSLETQGCGVRCNFDPRAPAAEAMRRCRGCSLPS